MSCYEDVPPQNSVQTCQVVQIRASGAQGMYRTCQALKPEKKDILVVRVAVETRWTSAAQRMAVWGRGTYVRTSTLFKGLVGLARENDVSILLIFNVTIDVHIMRYNVEVCIGEPRTTGPARIMLVRNFVSIGKGNFDVYFKKRFPFFFNVKYN